MDELTALAFHGSPYRTTEYLSADRPSRVFARIAADEGDQIFLFGHTHDQIHREAGMAHFVNPGSAGCPPQPGLAPWAVVDVEVDTLTVEFRTAPFDQEMVLNDLRAARLDAELLTAPPLERAAVRA
jgi:predicted phosphodiesterase